MRQAIPDLKLKTNLYLSIALSKLIHHDSFKQTQPALTVSKHLNVSSALWCGVM
jgi:hypothetical protein